jgi:hypothetical protein
MRGPSFNFQQQNPQQQIFCGVIGAQYSSIASPHIEITV